MSASPALALADTETAPSRPSPMHPSPTPETADEELMAAVAGGDTDALSQLYDRHAGRLNALALRTLRDTGAAEEVLQEVFLYVWRTARRYDPDRASVSTWLSLVTRSRALDRVRHRNFNRRTRDEYRHEVPVEHARSEGYANRLDEQRRRRVKEALDSLPEEQRGVLELAYYGGLTQSEIAERTGIPLGTVKTRTLLALRKLRRRLSAELDELL